MKISDLLVHVRGGLSSRARGGVVVASVDGPGLWLERDMRCGPELMHDGVAEAVIGAELVACTLGARVRPELTIDRERSRPLSHSMDALRAWYREIGATATLELRS